MTPKVRNEPDPEVEEVADLIADFGELLTITINCGAGQHSRRSTSDVKEQWRVFGRKLARFAQQ